MTVQDTITQAKYFTKKQKQQIGYYYLLSALKEDEQQEKNIMKFLNIKINNEEQKIEKKKNKTNPSIANLLKSKGILKDVDLSDITEEEIYLQED